MPVRATSWLSQAARRGLAAALPRRVYLTRGPHGNGGVSLTFDDGPHPEYTPGCWTGSPNWAPQPLSS
jgi:hypothetical protein